MYPSSRNFLREDLEERVESLWRILKSCTLCPHNCRVNRLKGEKGFCKIGSLPYVSSAQPHFGEEPPISGRKGSGAIFFSGCNLACVYCQNYEISQLRIGYEISFEELAGMMIRLQDYGCHNINLVTPTPQMPQIMKALVLAIEQGLKIPLVYNTGGYDSVETLRLLDGIVDIYMPDMKYGDDKTAKKYSLIRDYFKAAKNAVLEMRRQVGDLAVDERGIAVRGLLIRHLVLPNNLAGSKKVFEFLAKEVSENTTVNIMDQYHPCHRASEHPELDRRITHDEYKEAVEIARKAGLKSILS
jgi:putative pyruvate formate lyase activating enzyme